MNLRYLSIPWLIVEAGGDPWAITTSLESGRPSQIADLAKAFHDAARYSRDADAAFDEARHRFEAAWNHETGDHPINGSAEVKRVAYWLGVHAEQLGKIAADLENIAAALAQAQRDCNTAVSALEGQLHGIDDDIAIAVESEENRTKAYRSFVDACIDVLFTRAADDTRETLQHVTSICNSYLDTLHGASNTLHTDGYDPQRIQSFDSSAPVTTADRRQNQIDAFKQVFGREPTSTADWETAAILDPNSYDAKNDGIPPNIVVGRITPVPGQGVVRTNLFIPGRSVLTPETRWPPYGDNHGDDRGFSATAGPEDSRVSIYVDYENGLIVARQNPSIDMRSGQVRVGTPTISAVQKGNGGVLIKYNTADPFSPGGEDLAKGMPVSVNGTIAIEPSTAGLRVGGNVTNFPAVEIYNDRTASSTATLLQAWPKYVDGSLGPISGLWWDKPIGDPSLLSSFDDPHSIHVPPLPGNPPALSHIPVVVMSPPDTSPLGPVEHPPQVRIDDPTKAPPLPHR